MVTVYKYKIIHKAEHTESCQLTGAPLFLCLVYSKLLTLLHIKRGELL
jgi:hypothetical protein